MVHSGVDGAAPSRATERCPCGTSTLPPSLDERRLAAQDDELDLDGVGAADGDAVFAVVLELDRGARAVDRDRLGGVDRSTTTAHVEAAARDAQAPADRELDLGVAIEVDLRAVGEGELDAAALGAEPIAGDQRHAALGGFALALAIEAGEAVDGGDVGGARSRPRLRLRAGAWRRVRSLAVVLAAADAGSSRARTGSGRQRTEDGTPSGCGHGWAHRTLTRSPDVLAARASTGWPPSIAGTAMTLARTAGCAEGLGAIDM